MMCWSLKHNNHYENYSLCKCVQMVLHVFVCVLKWQSVSSIVMLVILSTIKLKVSCLDYFIKKYFVQFVVCLMVFNATFNTLSVISWRSVLLVEETGGPGETCHKPLTNFYHIMLYTSPWLRFELTTAMVIGTDCICSCKSNYHIITNVAASSMCWSFNHCTYYICVKLTICLFHSNVSCFYQQ